LRADEFTNCELLCLRLALELETFTEAVPEWLEGAPGQFRRRWSNEFKARAVAEAMEPGQAFRRLRIASAYIRHNYLAGVVMLVRDNDRSRKIRLFRQQPGGLAHER
jgi:hypothetical protein